MLTAALRSWASPVPPVQASRHVCAQRCVVARDGKMYVPSDSFGGLSPEKKASQALESLLTFTAAKIVLAQLEGSGRGALAAYNQSGYTVLSRQLQEVSLRDPDAWLDDLLKKDKGIALRLMEVRAAYATTDFEWEQLQRLSVKAVKDSNLALMRKAAAASLQASTAAPAAAALGAEQEGAAADAGAAAAPVQQLGQQAVASEAELPQQQEQQQEQQRQQQQQQQQVRGQATSLETGAGATAAAGETTEDKNDTAEAPTIAGTSEGPAGQPGTAAAGQDAAQQQE